MNGELRILANICLYQPEERVRNKPQNLDTRLLHSGMTGFRFYSIFVPEHNSPSLFYTTCVIPPLSSLALNCYRVRNSPSSSHLMKIKGILGNRGLGCTRRAKWTGYAVLCKADPRKQFPTRWLSLAGASQGTHKSSGQWQSHEISASWSWLWLSARTLVQGLVEQVGKRYEEFMQNLLQWQWPGQARHRHEEFWWVTHRVGYVAVG